MSGWLVVWPEGDPERIHVVPAKGEEPDPIHEPSPWCSCGTRIVVKRELAGNRREIVVHAGPN